MQGSSRQLQPTYLQRPRIRSIFISRIYCFFSESIATDAGPLSVCCVTVFFIPPATARYCSPRSRQVTIPPPIGSFERLIGHPQASRG
jgi:hypothetical protein